MLNSLKHLLLSSPSKAASFLALETKNMDKKNPPNTIIVPKWLKELGQQSWQPEMALSGVVIFSAFKLVPIVEQWQEWMMVSLAISWGLELLLLSLSFYIEGAIYSIIVFFIGHFILRTIWVGMVGVASVFPEGIRFNQLPYSPIFREQVKAKLQGMEHFNQKLDDMCSVVFALATLAVFSIVLPTFPIVIVGFCLELLSYILPSHFVMGIVLTVVALGLAISVILELPAVKQHPKRGKWYFTFFWNWYKSTFFIFAKPYLYIYFLFTSNISPTKFGLYTGFFFACIGLGIGMSSGGDNTNPFQYVEAMITGTSSNLTNSNTMEVRRYAYDNLRPEGERIKNIVIPSDIITETPYLKVFVPFIRKERAYLETLCVEEALTPDSLDQLTRAAKKNYKKKWRLNCLSKYYELQLNEQVYAEVDWNYYTHPNAGEKGFITYIPTKDLPNGKNVLTLIKHRKSKMGEEEDKIYTTVPFWWNGRGESDE